MKHSFILIISIGIISCWHCEYNESECWVQERFLLCLTCNIYKPIINGTENVEIETNNATLREVRRIIFEGGSANYLPSVLFKNFSLLTNISFINTQIESFGQNFFEESNQLEWLTLYNNLIEVFPANTFVNLRYLVGIDFEQKQLKEIQSDAFKNLTNLQFFFLKNSKIKEIDPLWFQDLESLTVLEFKRNKISIIKDGTFDSLQNVREIRLNDNLIKKIATEAFMNLPELVHVDLQENKCIDKDFGRATNKRLLDISAYEIDFEFCERIKKPLINFTTTSTSTSLAPQTTPSTTTESYAEDYCFAPFIKHGKVVDVNSNLIFRAGQPINSNIIVKTECNSGFEVSKEKQEGNLVQCDGGSFDKLFPKCIKNSKLHLKL